MGDSSKYPDKTICIILMLAVFMAQPDVTKDFLDALEVLRSSGRS